jgi:hypothetical protein
MKKEQPKPSKHTTLVLLWMASFMAVRVVIYNTPPASMTIGYFLQTTNQESPSNREA